MTERSFLKVLVTVSALAVLIALGWASPATAHDYCVHDGYDWGCVKNDHHTFSACDAETDGNRVYTEAMYRNQHGYLSVGATIGDPDGSGGLCGVYTVGWTIAAIRVCEYGPNPGGCNRGGAGGARMAGATKSLSLSASWW